MPSSDKTELIPCLLENRQNITKSKCKHLMTKLQAVVFSNYRLIKGFINDCSADVGKFKCGRLVSEEEEEVLNSKKPVIITRCKSCVLHITVDHLCQCTLHFGNLHSLTL